MRGTDTTDTFLASSRLKWVQVWAPYTSKNVCVLKEKIFGWKCQAAWRHQKTTIFISMDYEATDHVNESFSPQLLFYENVLIFHKPKSKLGKKFDTLKEPEKWKTSIEIEPTKPGLNWVTRMRSQATKACSTARSSPQNSWKEKKSSWTGMDHQMLELCEGTKSLYHFDVTHSIYGPKPLWIYQNCRRQLPSFPTKLQRAFSERRKLWFWKTGHKTQKPKWQESGFLNYFHSTLPCEISTSGMGGEETQDNGAESAKWFLLLHVRNLGAASSYAALELGMLT